MKTLLAVIAMAAASTVTPALAQQTGPKSVERRVLAERICPDGATTTVAVSGKLIMVEYFSAPRPDGTVAGYEDAYDFREAAEAKEQFDALRCPDNG